MPSILLTNFRNSYLRRLSYYFSTVASAIIADKTVFRA